MRQQKQGGGARPRGGPRARLVVHKENERLGDGVRLADKLVEVLARAELAPLKETLAEESLPCTGG